MKEEFIKLKETTLLIVEDEENLRDMITKSFDGMFKNILVATNGVEGLELFKRHSEINIIVSDINMPEMNGIEMMKKIKEYNSNIPFVFLTAHTQKEYLDEAINHNIDSYIVKPLEINKLLNELVEHI